jgi:hypothetical protein
MAPLSPAHRRTGAPSTTDMTDTDTEHDPGVGRWRPARTDLDGVRDADATRPTDRVGDVRTHPAHR